jgi:hypothetical protein
VLTYAAYLRIYGPVSAFHEPDRPRRAADAASAARPRRRDSLIVDHAEALRRAITAPQVVVPEPKSVLAQIRAAVNGAARGERELAAAIYMRAHSGWRAFAEFELGN